MLNANQELARNIAHLQEVYNSDCAFCNRYGDCHPCPDPDLLQKRADEWAAEYVLTDIVPLLLKQIQELQFKAGLTGKTKLVHVTVYMDEEGNIVLGGYGWQEFYNYEQVQTQRWRDLEAERIRRAVEPLPMLVGP
jgi:hypothetical protein